MVSGDFVFVGDLGRPDLLESAAGQAGAMEPSARRLFRTVRTLDGIPDFVQVWPAHGAGSACGKALGAVPTSTIGYERRFNPAIKIASSEQAFVDFILSGQPEPPLYFATMKRVNKVGPKVLGTLPIPPRMTASTLRAVDAKTAAIIDTRPWDAFRSGHVPGSMSFPLGKSFNTDAGSMVGETEDIYLIIEPARVEETVRDLVRVGLDTIKGWVDASEIEQYEDASHHLVDLPELNVDEAAAWSMRERSACWTCAGRRSSRTATYPGPSTSPTRGSRRGSRKCPRTSGCSSTAAAAAARPGRRRTCSGRATR